MGITHSFVSAKSDGTDDTLVRPSDWNDDHVITDDLLPWLVNIPPESAYATSTGTFALNKWTSESPIYGNAGIGIYNTSNAQNDEIVYPVVLSAGTWTFAMHHRKSSNLAIYTVYLDSTSLGTIDGYSSSAAAGYDTITGIVVSQGKHLLKIKAATRNGSSSGWYMEIFGLSLLRTS